MAFGRISVLSQSSFLPICILLISPYFCSAKSQIDDKLSRDRQLGSFVDNNEFDFGRRNGGNDFNLLPVADGLRGGNFNSNFNSNFNNNYNGSLFEVVTETGTIRGQESLFGFGSATSLQQRHYQFLGIPYAEAPIGPFRFKDPVPRSPLEQPLQATQFGPNCPQVGLYFSNSSIEEDCLFLNVFTPRIPARRGRVPDQSSLLPVMIYVHNGGNDFSSGSGVTDPMPLLEKGVIVVTFNYRLGIFGFLSLGDAQLSGNQGLKDQLEAFRWVQRNILAFGGDPRKITIFGGGASVHLHQVSPQGLGLYNGVIAQSGSALSMSEYMRKGMGVSEGLRMAEDIGCLNSNINLVVQCLQRKSTRELLNMTLPDLDFAVEVFRELNGTGGYMFGPVVDSYSANPFMPEHPLRVLLQGGQKDLPMITGITANEGAITMAQVWNRLPELSYNWTLYGPKYLFFSRPHEATPLEELKSNVTRHFYTGMQNFTSYLKLDLTHLFTDAQFLSPIYRAAEHQSRTQDQPVFFYELSHKPSQSVIDLLGQQTGANLEDFGVAHGDDMAFLFNDLSGNLSNAIATQDDLATREQMTQMWTNFAKHQDPTPFQEEAGLPTWRPFEQSRPNYLELGARPQAREGLHSARMYFWRRLYWQDMEYALLQQQQPLPQAPIANTGFRSAAPAPLPQGGLGSPQQQQVGQSPSQFFNNGNNGFFNRPQQRQQQPVQTGFSRQFQG